MHFPSFHPGRFVNHVMNRMDRNNNGQISINAHPNAGPRQQRLLAAADQQWTPFDFNSTRGDGFVTRHEVASLVHDRLDRNNNGRVGPMERLWARVKFGH